MQVTHKNTKIEVPTSWQTFTLRMWLDIRKTDTQDVLEFFSPIPPKDLTESQKEIFLIALSFLNEKPAMQKLSEINLLEKGSITQKFDAIKVIQKLDNNIEQALPHIYAIFSQDKNSYSIDTYNQKLEQILNETYISAFPECLSYMQSLLDSEESLSKAFQEIEITPEEKQAGIEKLQIFSNFNFIINLAKSFNISREDAKKVSIEDANMFMLSENFKAKYERDLQKIWSNKMKSKR